MLSPKSRRNIQRIFPFGIIWWVTGMVFIMVEGAAMGTLSPDSDVIISFSFSVFIFASVTVLIVGWLVGTLEMIVFQDLFRNRSFLGKIVYKMGLYVLLLFLVITIAYPVATWVESDIPVFEAESWQRYFAFLGSVTFLSVMLQMGFSMLLCLIYSGISENLGHSVLANFFTGKYHSPKEESRVFMFTDMKSSTAHAEKLGHIRYFDLLREYYAELSNGIIEHSGEVYQYIGDEVVISWKKAKGIENNNCLNCFLAMKAQLESRGDYYKQKYGIIPSFKAGLHVGDVTTGEMGALKKEIVFSGDVLNVTARIQGLCNHYNTDLLISGDLRAKLTMDSFQTASLGFITLKGRSEPMELYSLR